MEAPTFLFNGRVLRNGTFRFSNPAPGARSAWFGVRTSGSIARGTAVHVRDVRSSVLRVRNTALSNGKQRWNSTVSFPTDYYQTKRYLRSVVVTFSFLFLSSSPFCFFFFLFSLSRFLYYPCHRHVHTCTTVVAHDTRRISLRSCATHATNRDLHTHSTRNFIDTWCRFLVHGRGTVTSSTRQQPEGCTVHPALRRHDAPFVEGRPGS